MVAIDQSRSPVPRGHGSRNPASSACKVKGFGSDQIKGGGGRGGCGSLLASKKHAQNRNVADDRAVDETVERCGKTGGLSTGQNGCPQVWRVVHTMTTALAQVIHRQVRRVNSSEKAQNINALPLISAYLGTFTPSLSATSAASS
jgi:hypothetical protein